MFKLKKLSSCAVVLVFTMSAIAGGDPRDFGPVESFDSITISSEDIIEQVVLGKADSGITITKMAHNTCKVNLKLSDDNIVRFKEALAIGHLYNVGPLNTLGTLFSPHRWDNYLDCVEKYSSLK